MSDKHGWIAINDELPRCEGVAYSAFVWVWAGDTAYVGFYDPDDGEWHTGTREGAILNVTHWQPIKRPIKNKVRRGEK